MNKRPIPIFFFLVLSLVLAACQQEPERDKSKNQEDIPSSAKGITIQLKKEEYTPKDMDMILTLRNDSKTAFSYGKDYLLEKNVNGTWYEIPLKEGMGFTQMEYNLSPT